MDVVSDRMVNPFMVEKGASPDNKQPLMNIATFTVATETVTHSLLNVRKTGKVDMLKFVNKRLVSDETDFSEPIKKPDLKTFGSLNKPLVSKHKQETKSVNIDREIFSKLAVIGQARQVDLPSMLSYGLAPVSLTLFNLDSNLRKTAKNVTLSWLENDLAIPQLPQIEGKTLLVIDFMMLLRIVLTDTCDCSTFGELSDKLLHIVINNHSYTAIVGDSYQVDQSIKAGERARRGNILMQEIRNPSCDTPLPKQRVKMLSNPKNKANIANFLFQDWVNKCMDHLEDGRYLYLAGGFLDPQRTVLVTKGFKGDVPELKSDHEETDSRMFLHISYAHNMFKPVRTIL